MIDPALLSSAHERATGYLAGLAGRPVRADTGGLDAFREPFPTGPCDPQAVLALLDAAGSPATMATAGPRYFGFVNGGTLPAALAAGWLSLAWDQNAALSIMSPVAAALEEVALGWTVGALGLPAGTGGGFVTGATMANFSALAAARRTLSARAGWDVEADGLYGAPPLRVVVGAEAHTTVHKALGMLGLGRNRVELVPSDRQGRLIADALPALDDRTIVCLQAGNVNSGAFDPFESVCERAEDAGAWVHVDGAFGLWAAATPALADLVVGLDRAQSWATDGHKWLNTSYDSGIVLVRDPAALRGGAYAVQAAYLPTGERREPSQFTPEASRRARGVEVWAALRSLGREGVAHLVERCCAHARRFAAGLAAAGIEVLNDVVLNQVVVAFGRPGDDARTTRVIEAIQADGTCWAGATVWQGRAAMRISVSNWSTTEADVDASVAAMVRCATA